MKNEKISAAELDMLKLFARTIRGLSMDGVQAANSGHPGLPLGMADAAAVLWGRHLRHYPANPKWANRDRFVLSAGHGSMLIYSLLHLSGYDLPLNELQNFRQWGSKTPGHPEHGLTAGIETTTGPLGQGISNAVGLALAEKWLANHFNRADAEIVDHYTYVIASDGDLMEGVSHEACSIAGHLGLGKLIVLYDDNSISIDGSTDLAFSENIPARFAAYGWHTLQADGHDMQAIDDALATGKAEKDRPTIISCKSVIGYGSPNRAGTAKAHGEPLGDEERALTKEKLGIPETPLFFVPEEMATYKEAVLKTGRANEEIWNDEFSAYREKHPALAAEWDALQNKALPENFAELLPDFNSGDAMATRKASGAVINAIFSKIPSLIGGSADLSGSNNTFPKGEKAISAANFSGRYIHYGVREHGMGAIMNGLALHGEFIPYGGTFLVFSDYMRGSIRLAALMEQQVIYVLTHDSIGLGEDGPTHQPIEHLMALRAIPNLTVIRPAEASETAGAWRAALENRHGPTALVLTRQGLTVFGTNAAKNGVAKGAYALADSNQPQAILMASGSEVHIALAAQKLLAEKSIPARVVSMPSMELFDAQPEAYRDAVLPPEITARVAIEAGATLGWYKYVGQKGAIFGLDRFGESAPYKTAYEKLGLTAENAANAVLGLLSEA